MYMRTVFGNGEAEENLEQLLYGDQEALQKPKPLRVERHFDAEHFLVAACVFTAVHFDLSNKGIEQYEVAIKGSEFARNAGKGQIIPSLLGEFHDKYRNDRLSIALDCDSYSPEKLLCMGYVAIGMIPENGVIELVDPEILRQSQLTDLVAA